MENQDLLSDFLGNVAEKIKTAKEHKSIMEAVYASASATETVTEQGDPFAHFLQKVGNTIASKLPAKEPIVEESKQEEVPGAEATQEAAVHLGNKIRQALEQAKKQPKETPVPVVPAEEEPPDENKPVQALAQKIKDAIEKAKTRALEQPAVPIQSAVPQEEQEDNQIAGYIEELEKIKDTGTVEQQEEATTSLKELKKYIDKTVQDYARRILDLGGGGGSVAVQYAKGGTMDGNLSVNNLYPNNNNGEIGSPSNRWDRIYVNNIDSLSSNIVVELSGFFVDGDFTVNGLLSAQNATFTNNLSVGGTIYSSATALVLAEYETLIGNGVNNSFTVNHNLNTDNIQAVVYDVGNNIVSYPSIQILNSNSISVAFSFVPPLNYYRVLVFGSVPSNQINAYGQIYTFYTTATGFGDIPVLSGNWNSTYQTVCALSALWSQGGQNAGTASYILTAQNFIMTGSSSWAVDTLSNTVSGTLPVSPSTGMTMRFLDARKTWATSNFVVVRSGQLIESLAENLNCDISGYSFSLTYVGGAIGWRVY